MKEEIKIKAKGWKSLAVPTEVYERVIKFYDEKKDELKLKNGVRSLTSFLNFCIREYLKEKQAI